MKALLLTLFFPILLFAQAWTPVDYVKWQNPAQANEFQARIGGELANYPETEVDWAPIENDWITQDDTLHTNYRAVLKIDVTDNGQSVITLVFGGDTCTVTQKLKRLIWVNTDTWDTTNIFTQTNWDSIRVDSNVIHWHNVFTKIDYEVHKYNGSVAHRIFFKPAFLNAAVNYYNNCADSLSLGLANVIVYTLTGVDNPDSVLGELDGRVLKRWARHVFRLNKTSLHFPGSDTLEGAAAQKIRVHHKWVRMDGKIVCVEWVKMKWLKAAHLANPTSVIWHDDAVSIGAADIEDTYIAGGISADKNYGNVDPLRIESDPYYGLVRVKNVASNLGVDATITACVCSLNCEAPGNTMAIYRIFKPWGEGTSNGFDPGSDGSVTWNDWACDANEWTTVGGQSADDGGSDNSGDGVGADRKATAEDTQNPTGIGWYSWTISNALAQGWYDETINEEGIMFIETVDTYAKYTATEDGTAADRPRFSFTFTTNGEPPPAAAPTGQVIIIQ